MKRVILTPLVVIAMLAGLASIPFLREKIHAFFTINPILWLNSRNFHAIDDHVYRSAQLSPKVLKRTIEEYDINAILNLRSPKSGKETSEWYMLEQEIAYNNGVKLIHVPLNDTKPPSNEKLERILEFFERKKHRPMLIHCHAGADRTGMVAGLYILEMKYGKDGDYIDDEDGEALTEALAQLRFSYGHYALLHPAMKKFIRHWYELRKDYTRNEALEKYDPKDIRQHFPLDSFQLYPA